MPATVKRLSSGERFSAIILIVAFFSVIIPAAVEVVRHDAFTPHQVTK